MRFTSSLNNDERIFQADILVGLAHVVMLVERGIVSKTDGAQIAKGLLLVEREGFQKIRREELEDVHACIEARLEDIVPKDAAGRLHTARSRNDEVSTCIRIALRQRILLTGRRVASLIEILAEKSAKETRTIMPGYTHLQIAQPTTYAHHLLAYCEALLRDLQRILQSYSRVNLSPLGSCALSGTSFPIDRNRTAQLLGFTGLVENSLDASSTRDFVIESLGALANLSSTMSRFCEEMILWNSKEFGYIDIPDEYASPSSIMPQKKNPDPLEISRARCAKITGHLVSALSILKALPYAYNRDLQELTPILWSAFDDIDSVLEVITGLSSNMTPRREVMSDAVTRSFGTATELADTIVREKNLPFRTAHNIVGALMRVAISKKISLSKVGGRMLDEASEKTEGITLGFSDREVRRALDPERFIASRRSIGSPSPVHTKRMSSKTLRLVKEVEAEISRLEAKVTEAESELRNLADKISQ